MSNQKTQNRNGHGTNTRGKKRLTKKQRRKRKITIFVIEIVVLLLLLAGLYVVTKLNKIDKEEVKESDLDINELDSETAELLEGYTTIALFGIDNHETGSLTSGRTDTIMVACINNDSKEVKIVSVYRDTYLNLTDGKYNKANSAYSAGGPTQAISMLDNNMDLDITDYVTVDFGAMVDMIDLIGGIELDITEDEAKVMNGEMLVDGHYCENYIEELEQDTGKSSSRVSAGTQVCDGIQATAYCRIRYTSGDDFKRSERQRTVLSKMVEKAKKSDIGTLNKLINAIFPEISTSYSNAEILAMASKMMEYEMVDTAGFPFYKTTGTVGSKGSLVIPCDLKDNVSYLHEYLYGDTSYTPSDTVLNISKKIVSDTGKTSSDANEQLYGSKSTSEDTTIDDNASGSSDSSDKEGN